MDEHFLPTLKPTSKNEAITSLNYMVRADNPANRDQFDAYSQRPERFYHDLFELLRNSMDFLDDRTESGVVFKKTRGRLCYLGIEEERGLLMDGISLDNSMPGEINGTGIQILRLNIPLGSEIGYLVRNFVNREGLFGGPVKRFGLEPVQNFRYNPSD